MSPARAPYIPTKATKYEPLLKATRSQRRRFWKHVSNVAGCWLWNMQSGNRYGFFYFKKKKLSAHRVAKTWAGRDVRQAFLCCHKCPNRNCVRPSHIEWGDFAKNGQDRIRDGTNANPRRGELAPLAKLLLPDVVSMCHDFVAGMTIREIVAKYAHKRGTIVSVLYGQNWQAETQHILKDRHLRKKNRRGEKFVPWNRKLTVEQVVTIKQALAAGGQTHQQIADKVGTTKGTVTGINMKRSWVHVRI